MKKFLALSSILCLIVSFSSCSLGSKKVESELRTQEQLSAYLNRETDAEMSFAGPFYFGNFEGFDPLAFEYSKAREEKVNEILEIMDESVDLMREVDKKLREEKEIFAEHLAKIKEIEKKAKGYTNKFLTATNISNLSSALSDLVALKNSADKAPLGSVWGYLQFERLSSIFSLTELYTIEAASLVHRTVSISYLLESDKSNPEFKNISDSLVSKINPVSEDVNDLIAELYHKNAMLVYGRKVLLTGDIDFAKKALVSVDAKLLEVKNLLSSYTGGNDYLNAEMPKLFEKKVSDLEEYKNEISTLLDELKDDPLVLQIEALPVSYDKNGILPTAYADDLASYFQQKIKDAIKTAKFAKDMTVAAVRVSGKKLKEAYDSSGAHEAIKDGAQIVNGGLEIVNSGVEVTIYGVQGIYFGDTDLKDMQRRIEQEKQELYEKFLKGTLGKDQYDEMIHQVNQFQKNTGTFINNMSDFAGDMTGILTRPEVGKFVKNVTRGVGNEAKKVLDTATDFTKNLAIVMHPETSKEDTRNALIDIYTALKAVKNEKGEYVNVEMPDLIELAKEQAKKELGLSKDEEKKFVEQLTEIFEEELKGGEVKKEEVKKKEKPTDPSVDAIAKILATPGLSEEEKADLILVEIVKGVPSMQKENKDGTKGNILDIDGDGIGNEDDNCPQESNSDQGDLDKDAIGNVCDPDCSADSDNDGLCNEVDNCPNVDNGDQKDSNDNGVGDVCDDSAPPLSEVEKDLEGELTITEVNVTEEARRELTAQGCDVQSLEEKEGTKSPTQVKLQPKTEDTGTMYLYSQGEEINVPFVYEDGVIQGSSNNEGAKVEINMDFNSGKPTGDLHIEYLEGQVELNGELSF
ncbi:MAG: thrombospondin type 3 repeat-containing protein [Candidatus Gracilibacteria bacterium]|jgi:hypothetical protein|nr:thrombospondin type 3 repeat-containing protein [Candidatus Gracilibacteria bacterium]